MTYRGLPAGYDTWKTRSDRDDDRWNEPEEESEMYDTKCHDLAEAFLSDEPAIDSKENIKELAQIIQNAIEDFIEEKRKDNPT